MTFAGSDILSVRPDEADFLGLVRAVMGFAPANAAAVALAERRPPIEMGHAAMGVLRDTLARGLVMTLVRDGGHAVRRSLADDGKATSRGRLWERHAAPVLSLSLASIELLRQIHVLPLFDDVRDTSAIPAMLTPGDEVVFLLAADLCARAGFQRAIATPLFAGSVLVRIAYPAEQRGPLSASAASRLLSGPGAIVADAMRRRLGLRVHAADVERRAEPRVDAADEIASSVGSGTVAFVRAAIAAGRPDLGFFLLDGVARLLAERAREGAGYWSVAAARSATLEQRQRKQRGALPLLEGALLFRSVASQARSVGFVDDEYESARAVLELLEGWNDAGFEQVLAAVREVSSFGSE